jgi:uncharacterized protein YbaP (TraB family)
MMKTIQLLFLLLFGWNGIAQTPYPMTESSLLWKIEGEGVQKGCYLFGTMHLIQKDYFYFPENLTKIVTKSDKLVMELPGLPNQLEALKYVKLEEGTFFDFFTENQKDSILDWVKNEVGMSEESFTKNFNEMKPFAIVQLATQMHFVGKTESYEMTLDKLARENKLRIAGLETIADQMKIFDDLTKEQQVEMVMSSVRDPKGGIEITQKMMQVYASQEIDSLFMMVEEEGGVLSEEQNAFLDQRNSNWIPLIEDHIKESKTFIAVGAAHLGGPKGVIRLLEENGYKVTPVKL